MRFSGAQVKAPAKINLQLGVGALQDDGYHSLATVYQAISLYDEVKVFISGTLPYSKSVKDIEIDIELSGTFTAGVPKDESNLAAKSARFFISEILSKKKDVNYPEKILIKIQKEIPTAGGMAGGTADGAAVLVALDAIFECNVSRAELEVYAQALGSDFPFSLAGGVAIGKGHGEEITSVLYSGDFYWVLAFSQSGLSTPAVFKECDRLREGQEVLSPEINDDLLRAIRNGDCTALGKALSNDLQAAAISLKPDLNSILEIGKEFGVLGGIVSGSGPTVAFLVADHENCVEFAAALTASRLVSGVAMAMGPVPGAKTIEMYSAK